MTGQLDDRRAGQQDSLATGHMNYETVRAESFTVSCSSSQDVHRLRTWTYHKRAGSLIFHDSGRRLSVAEWLETRPVGCNRHRPSSSRGSVAELYGSRAG